MTPYRVGILGATGLVGQRLVERLVDHPWFRLTTLAASERSAGRTYAEAVRWRLSGDPPADVRDKVVRACRPGDLGECDLLLSALDSAVGGPLEPSLRDAGFAVISNCSAHRQSAEVPILIPEVNPSHLVLVERQRARAGGGFLVTNPNCSATGLALVVAPLHRAFGVRRLVVSTLQALSGAGMEGPRALELVDNVVPHIAGEEEKIERELAKILGRATETGIEPGEIAVSAHCHRVGTVDGHLEAVSLELGTAVGVEEVTRALEAFGAETREPALPSAPPRAVAVRDEPDRPQPRLDRDAGGGMTVVVGRIRPCAVLGIKLELLSHNTVRGAAGGTLLNAELLAARGLLPRRGTA